jgi:hypothetical protein
LETSARIEVHAEPHFSIIPAQAGIQPREAQRKNWIPAFAGMTLC